METGDFVRLEKKEEAAEAGCGVAARVGKGVEVLATGVGVMAGAVVGSADAIAVVDALATVEVTEATVAVVTVDAAVEMAGEVEYAIVEVGAE